MGSRNPFLLSVPYTRLCSVTDRAFKLPTTLACHLFPLKFRNKFFIRILEECHILQLGNISDRKLTLGTVVGSRWHGYGENKHVEHKKDTYGMKTFLL